MCIQLLKTAEADEKSSWKNSRKTLWGVGGVGGGYPLPLFYVRGLKQIAIKTPYS